MSVEVLKQIWPEWSIRKRIGGGAYGTVYEASRNEYGVDNHAAIKIISIPASEAEIDTLRSEGLDMQATKSHFQTIVNDFVNEIRLMVSLEGRPNIVNVKDYKVVEKKGEFGWHIFILMELLTPFVVYTCDHQMTEAEVIKLGCDICTALETCAEEKIIHRDIKPGNILVHKSGDFKLGDFGIARKLEDMTGGLSQRYTPKYMAPEVATSMYYDERVDIYSLGIVLYELLNGRRIPFQPNKQINSLADIENAVRRRNSGEALPNPSNASPAMADLILRACAYEPNMRFSSATEMKQALMSVANGSYRIGESNLDRTTSVRKAIDSYDKTTSVRRAPAATKQKSASSVNTFGSAPKPKSKIPAVILAILAVVLIAGAGIFAVPKLLDRNDSNEASETSGETSSETAEYSKFDEEQIASIISETETLAAEEDYEGALLAGEYDAATEIVDAARKQLPNNNALKEESEKIEAAKPVYLLSTLSPYEKPYWYNADGMFSMGGQNYTHGFTCMGYGDKPYGNETYFNLNGEYSYMSFTAGIVDGNRSNGDVGFMFYADGELIYGVQMGSRDLPTEHIIDVTGCKQLKIAVYDGYRVADGSGTYGLGNIMITRNISSETSNKTTSSLEDNQVYLLKAVTPYDTPYWYDDSDIISMGGQTYTHGFSCMGYGDKPDGNAMYFNLNGQYTKLSFTSGIISNNRSNKDVTITVYADGEIADSFTMPSSALPTTHSVDITGCKQLKITVYDGYWVADGSGTYGFADMILTKK